MKPQDIREGMTLTPSATWNRTSPNSKKLPERCQVLGVSSGHSQTGVMVKVQFKSGGYTELDAGWFLETQKAAKAQELQRELFDK